MSTLPPNEPLDEEERELARVLRALPGGEPPAALDAAILRAAANAAASSRRPVRRALASAGALWGIGSAAAAVLALGVAWQLRYGVNDTSASAERASRAHLVADDAEDDSVQVDIPAQAQNAPMAPPPPAMAAEKAAPAAASGPRRELAAKPARVAPAAAEPEAFANDKLEERQVASGAISPAELQSTESATAPSDERMKEKLRDQEMASAEAADHARAEAGLELKGQAAKTAQAEAYANAASTSPPPPPAAYRPAAVGGGFVAAQSPAKPAAAAPAATAPAPALAQSRADSNEDLDKVIVVGAVDQKDAAALPKKPATWLADIRKLREQGKIEQARAALVEFRKKYPKWVIPTDLAPLLKQ
jgi:hypothetical protein